MNLNHAFGTAKPQTAAGGGGLNSFGTAGAAPDFEPVPPGIYTARVQCGEYTTTRANDDAFRMRFEIVEGPQTGKTVLRIWTFGMKALPYTERDLGKFGLTTPEHLLGTFPEPGKEYRVRIVVAVQIGNDGIKRNDIKRFDVLSVADAPDADFLLPTRGEGGSQ